MSLTPKNWASFQHYKDRSPAWIKLHRGLLDDYAFTRLPVASRALAPLLWLLASEYEEGRITASLDEIGFRLRMSETDLLAALKPLIEAGFFIDDSNALAERKRDACLEREEEKRERREDIRSVADATRPKIERWDEFRKAYPKRKGSNPWKPAFDAYERHVMGGVTEETLITGARQLAQQCRVDGQINTPYVPQAVTWLRQQRWGDAEPVTASSITQNRVFVPDDHPAWSLWQAVKKTPSTDGRDATGRLCRGWHFDSEFPPQNAAA